MANETPTEFFSIIVTVTYWGKGEPSGYGKNGAKEDCVEVFKSFKSQFTKDKGRPLEILGRPIEALG